MKPNKLTCKSSSMGNFDGMGWGMGGIGMIGLLALAVVVIIFAVRRSNG
jgi:hypothetical protein